MRRALYGVALLISAFILPWWIVVLFSVLGILYFPQLYEVIVVGLILDTLYGANISLQGISIVCTIGLTCALYVVTNIKSRIFI
jgi:hypothetical protein